MSSLWLGKYDDDDDDDDDNDATWLDLTWLDYLSLINPLK